MSVKVVTDKAMGSRLPLDARAAPAEPPTVDAAPAEDDAEASVAFRWVAD